MFGEELIEFVGVGNEVIREIMKVHNIIEEIKEKQLEWYGHVRRMGEERLLEKTLRWNSRDRNKRGRPKKRVVRSRSTRRHEKEKHPKKPMEG